ncbi:MAG: GAP family protein [Microbacteriaceae bacterium]
MPDGANPNAVGGVVRIAIGVLLLGLAVRKWRARPADGARAAIPGWMSSITTASSVRSFVTGVVLSAGSPKNIAITAAAGIALGTSGLTVTELVWSIVVYVVIASLSILIPVIAFAMFAERLRDRLILFEDWLLQNNAALMSILLVVFGFVVIGEGIGSF